MLAESVCMGWEFYTKPIIEPEALGTNKTILEQNQGGFFFLSEIKTNFWNMAAVSGLIQDKFFDIEMF